MLKLIEALTIFSKYTDCTHPTHCEHDVMYVVDVDKESVSAEDLARLEKLGFEWHDDMDCFGSYRYGSA